MGSFDSVVSENRIACFSDGHDIGNGDGANVNARITLFHPSMRTTDLWLVDLGGQAGKKLEVVPIVQEWVTGRTTDGDLVCGFRFLSRAELGYEDSQKLVALLEQQEV